MAVYKDKKTGKWFFRSYIVEPITGIRSQKSKYGFELKKEAQEAEFYFKNELKNNKIDYTNISIGYLIDEYFKHLKRSVKITTYTGYVYQIEKHIKPFFKDIKLRNMNRIIIDEWYDKIDKNPIDSKFKNKILSRLKGLFEYAESQYDVRIRSIQILPPFKNDGVIRRKAVTIYTEKDVDKFIEHTENELQKTVFMTLFYTGLRISELRGLKWSDVNLEAATIKVSRQVTSKVPGVGSIELSPKSKSSIRTIHIPTILKEQLLKWEADRKQKRSFRVSWQVFGDMTYIHETGIRRWVKRVSESAGLDYIKLHELRHSYTTLLHNKKVPAKIVQEQLGHSSVQITLDVYTHINDSDIKDAIDKVFDDEE